MNATLKIIKQAIQNPDFDFHIVDRRGNKHEVYDANQDGRFVIADDEGIRKLVSACASKDCDCGRNDYYVPEVVRSKLIDTAGEIMSSKEKAGYADQYNRLLDILKVVKEPANVQKGQFIRLKDRNYENIHKTSPRPEDLVYVTNVYDDFQSGLVMFKGLVADEGYVKSVTDEAWRYVQVTRDELETGKF